MHLSMWLLYLEVFVWCNSYYAKVLFYDDALFIENIGYLFYSFNAILSHAYLYIKE